jgi:hypothetical protein
MRTLEWTRTCVLLLCSLVWMVSGLAAQTITTTAGGFLKLSLGF